jgi:hypothetical protein
VGGRAAGGPDQRRRAAEGGPHEQGSAAAPGEPGPAATRGVGVGARRKVEEGRALVVLRWELVGKKSLTRVSAGTD